MPAVLTQRRMRTDNGTIMLGILLYNHTAIDDALYINAVVGYSTDQHAARTHKKYPHIVAYALANDIRKSNVLREHRTPHTRRARLASGGSRFSGIVSERERA